MRCPLTGNEGSGEPWLRWRNLAAHDARLGNRIAWTRTGSAPADGRGAGVLAELRTTQQRLAEAEAHLRRLQNLEAQFSWEVVDVVEQDPADAGAVARTDG